MVQFADIAPKIMAVQCMSVKASNKSLALLPPSRLMDNRSGLTIFLRLLVGSE